IDEDDKRNAHAAAFLLCQPSVNESFSIVLMDSWLGETPVLVNGKCDVTRDHCIRSGGGLYFNDYFEFEELINFLLAEKDTYSKMALSGAAYVREQYSWDAVLARFEKALEGFGL
ncbi:MAG: glycosyltransferase, partial [Candidatus Theseobacter exili]|nr:glycosyltransferase [Candidatus Theseobacter exili]